MPQQEIARRFRVTPHLVSNLVRDSKKKPEKLREVKAREKLATDKKQAIIDVVNTMIQSG
jgi:hypothetical protein